MAPDAPPTPRSTLLERPTNETKVQISLSIDGGPLDFLPESEAFALTAPSSSASIAGSGPPPRQNVAHHASQDSPQQQIWVWTGVGFFDHMLHALAKHAGWSLRVRVRGDLIIDDHHTVEDTMIALGAAFNTCLGDRKGLKRFGFAYAPLDEALARSVIDLSNRPYFDGQLEFTDAKIGALTTQMVHHALQSFAQHAGVTLHVDVIKGFNDHHKCEAAFKSLAVACREACTRVVGMEGVVISTKGVL